jgi:hypothetical protein
MGVPINNVTRRVVFAASGTGPYAFTFEILAATDIAVYRDDTLLTLTTNYTVTINANGTGSVTLTAAPTGATQIAIVGNRTIQRTSDFVTGGDFFANTLNDELDQQTIFAQQNAEGLARALQAPQTDPTTINMTLPRAADRANKYLAFDANGNPQPGDTAVEVGAIAAIADEVEAVAAIDTEVTTVAGIDTEITTVAGISSAVSGVAAISSAVTAVNSNSSNINSVNSNSANINTVAGAIANVNSVGTNIANVNAVAGELGAGQDVTVVAADLTGTDTIGTVAGSIANVNAVGTNIANVNSVDSNETNINTVAGISANVTTVAGVAANVTTVAGISANVTTVAGISANVTSVAGNSTNINSVASNSTNINAVAGNATNINAVAGISADVTTVATNVADITNFSDVYLGPKTSNPTQRNDTTALQAGDLYFNTVAVEMRVYTGSAWQALPTLPDLTVEKSFKATAGQTSYTFAGGYRVGFTYVWVNGALLYPDDITATNGSTITFGTALALDDEVRILTFKAVASVTAADTGALPTTGGTLTGNVTLNAQSDLRFADSDSSNWVAFQAPATVASNVTWTLPSADGTSGQVLQTDGSGALSFATPSAGVTTGKAIAMSIVFGG